MNYNQRAKTYKANEMTNCEQMVLAAMYAGFRVLEMPIILDNGTIYRMKVEIETTPPQPFDYPADGCRIEAATAKKVLAFTCDFQVEQIDGESRHDLHMLMQRVYRDLKAHIV